ncbi:hypothetical protein G7046_g1259 [Stylonectria norvegica]|nr:hypothetical protein G7046_g1259 [Stylonectria norvegica]
MPKPSGSRVERTRTFTGCRTCRGRHAKCDEAQPTCGTCRRLGLDCGGYGARLSWITDDSALGPEQQQSHRGSPYRYPLFTEVHRRLMSAELSDSLDGQAVVDLLSDIDPACEGIVNNSQGFSSQVKGPFGVFHVQHEPWSPSSQSSESSNIIVDSELGVCPEQDDSIEEMQRQDWSDRLNETNFDLFIGSLDPTMGVGEEDGNSPGQLLISDSSMTNFFLENPPAVEGLSLFSPSFVSRAIASAPDPSNGLLQCQGNSLNLPEFTEPLLHYYKQHVVGATASMQAKRKSPWQLIFLPCALETFAELSLWNGTSHTRFTILYTLLAHSAFQLHVTNKSGSFANHWRETEMFGPKQAKYKELLMAILAMAMTSLYNGAHAFRIFLLDAERLIRLRGLVDANPYKIRLLHHMYTHLRVIAESVSICAETISNPSQNLREAADVRTFRLAEDSLNIGLDPAHEKSLDVGYRDIHLQIQGHWKETLYPVIYGIPESLMTLLSQTISVANEKARLESLARRNPQLSVDLAHHVKTLETSIWSWSLATESMGPPRPPRPPRPSRPPRLIFEADQELMDHPQARPMALAIHQALVIYFYRRIYDMNARILQDLVRKTLDYLEPCMEHMMDDQDFAASLAWPAFIAACEAVSPDLQEKALRCLTATDERGLFFTPKPAKEIVSLIWERRKQSGDWSLSWPSILMGC